MDPEIAALIARQTIDKADTERLNADVEWGEVVGWDVREGVVTFVTVVLNAAPNTPVYCSSLIGSNFATGRRVAVWWTKAGGAYVIGSDEDTSSSSDAAVAQHPYLVADATGTIGTGVEEQVTFNATVDSWPGGETVRPWREPDDGTNPIDFATAASITINEDGLYHIVADVKWEIESSGPT